MAVKEVLGLFGGLGAVMALILLNVLYYLAVLVVVFGGAYFILQHFGILFTALGVSA